MWMLLVITVVTFVLGIPFLLWWWKLADIWLDAEHRRFKPKDEPSANTIVVRSLPRESATPPNASNADTPPQFVSTSGHDSGPDQPAPRS